MDLPVEKTVSIVADHEELVTDARAVPPRGGSELPEAPLAMPMQDLSAAGASWLAAPWRFLRLRSMVRS